MLTPLFPRVRVALVALSVFLLPGAGRAQVLQPPYSADYTVVDLGQVGDVPANYGGLTFLDGNPNTLLIGGAANGASGKIYSIGVTRNAMNHITGFAPTSAVFADGPNNDGGLAYIGPGGVLFYTLYPTNHVGEIKPGSTTVDKQVDMSPLGVASSVGGLNFVPAGFPGAGHFKVTSFNAGVWYDVPLTPDGSGTYDAGTPTATVSGLPSLEGFVYVPLGSTDFANPSLLMCEYGAGKIGAYQVDANGDPVVATRADFITGLSGAEGAVIDPLTGDFLFSTYGGGSHVVLVTGGFVAPTTTTTTTETTTSTTETTTTESTTTVTTTSSTTTTTLLDHFACYKVRPTKGAPKFGGASGLQVVDRFGSSTLDAAKTLALCAPASKNHGDPSAPSHPAHLDSYTVKATPAFAKLTKQGVMNQFGTLHLDVVKQAALLVPAAKSLTVPPSPPAPPGVDHFTCYKAKVSKGSPKFQPIIGVSVDDQFGSHTVDLKKPTKLCAPADKNGEAPGAELHPSQLVCYLAKPSAGTPDFTVVSPVYVADQLGSQTLDVVKPAELCVPSLVAP